MSELRETASLELALGVKACDELLTLGQASLTASRWITACVSATISAPDIHYRDPISGHSLPRSLHAMFDDVRSATASGSNPLPADQLQQLIEFVLPSLRDVLGLPRTKIVREHLIQPMHRLREMDAKCTEWLGRLPGRSVREKLAGRNSAMGVQRDFSPETVENRLVAKLLRALLPRIDARLVAIDAGAYDTIDPDREEELRDCERVCRRALRTTAFGEIDHRAPIHPNNVLLGDRRYLCLWRGWRRLSRLDELEQRNITQCETQFRHALLLSVSATIAGLDGVGFGDRVARTKASDDSASGSGQTLALVPCPETETTKSSFVWKGVSELGFLLPLARESAKRETETASIEVVGDAPQRMLERMIAVRCDGDSMVIEARPHTGEVLLDAAEHPTRTIQLDISFWEGETLARRGIPLRIAHNGQLLVDSFADVEGLRSASNAIAALLRPARTASAVQPIALGQRSTSGSAIDLAGTQAYASLQGTDIVLNTALYAVGFSIADASDTPASVEWFVGDKRHPFDVFDPAAHVAPLRVLFDDTVRAMGGNETQSIEALSRVVRGLAEEIEHKVGVATGRGFACAIPDSADEFAQHKLRGQLSAAFGRAMPLWRTSALVAGWQETDGFVKANVKPGDAVITFDPCSDGLAACIFTACFDKELEIKRPCTGGIHWERRPAFTMDGVEPSLARMMGELSWTQLLTDFARRCLADAGCGVALDAQTRERLGKDLVAMGVVEAAVCERRATRITLGLESCRQAIDLQPNAQIWGEATKHWNMHFGLLLTTLLRTDHFRAVLRDARAAKGVVHILFAGVPFSASSNLQPLVKIIESLGEQFAVHIAERTHGLAARGAAAVVARESVGLPSFRNWLPELRLEVVADGGFQEFVLMEETIASVVSISKKTVIRIDNVLRIPAGLKRLTFPMFEGRTKRRTHDAWIESDAFPLSTAVDATLEITYSIGKDNPFSVSVTPIGAKLSKPIHVRFERRTQPDSKAPRYPTARGWDDPTIVERVLNLEKDPYRWRELFIALRDQSSLLTFEEYDAQVKQRLWKLETVSRILWDEGRSLATAPTEMRLSIKKHLQMEGIRSIAALEKNSEQRWLAKFGDQRLCDGLIGIGRRILSRQHIDSESELLPIALDMLQERGQLRDAIEMLGSLVGDGEFTREVGACKFINIVRECVEGQYASAVNGTGIVALGSALWRSPRFLFTLQRTDSSFADTYLRAAGKLLRESAKQTRLGEREARRVRAPVTVRAIGQTVLALLRLRDCENPPAAVAAGTQLLAGISRDFLDAEAALRDDDLLLTSFLQFDFKRDPRLHATSDLAFVLRHYLTGDSSELVEIVGRHDDDE